MIYSHEVEHMCVVAKGANHASAPIPQEGNGLVLKRLKTSMVLLTVLVGVLQNKVLVN